MKGVKGAWALDDFSVECYHNCWDFNLRNERTSILFKALLILFSVKAEMTYYYRYMTNNLTNILMMWVISSVIN